MNVQDKVRELRRRVEREASRYPTPCDGGGEKAVQELEVLRNSCLRLSHASDAVGRMPPSPHTRRARMGSYLIRIMQRALFWYTPPIVRFQNEAAHALSTAGNLFEMQGRQILAQQQEIRVLRAEMLRLQSSAPRPASGAVAGNGTYSEVHSNGAEKALIESFLFASYDRLRGPEGETARKLDRYLQLMGSLAIPEGRWLDLGCGRGEWLIAAGAAGHTVSGVDSSPAAAAYCRGRGIQVAEEDALRYLRGVPSQSLAVITAFHVIEHCGTADLLGLIRESARALTPGGVLIFETPDPANLMMASHLFWRDPSHRHPVPMLLLQLMFEYFGLTVVERLRLNPLPAAERLPFGELEFVRRLNEHFYGPQDYALIGRR